MEHSCRALAGGTPHYAEYRFKPLLDSGAILERFEGERRTFLANLFRQARKGRTWLTLDAGAAAGALGVPRDRVVRALDWLGEQGMLEVQAAGVRHRYRRLRHPDDPDSLAADLHRRLTDREEAELGRLRQVVELAGLDGCRTAMLTAHFGEAMEAPCGHCSGCLDQAPGIPERQAPPIPGDLAETLAPLLEAQAEVLDSPRAVARFLCGISSPRLGRARLGGHELFGALAEVPFREVVAWAEQVLGAG